MLRLRLRMRLMRLRVMMRLRVRVSNGFQETGVIEIRIGIGMVIGSVIDG